MDVEYRLYKGREVITRAKGPIGIMIKLDELIEKGEDIRPMTVKPGESEGIPAVDFYRIYTEEGFR